MFPRGIAPSVQRHAVVSVNLYFFNQSPLCTPAVTRGFRCAEDVHMMEASYGVPRAHPFGRDTVDLPRWKYDTRDPGDDPDG